MHNGGFARQSLRIRVAAIRQMGCIFIKNKTTYNQLSTSAIDNIQATRTFSNRILNFYAESIYSFIQAYSYHLIEDVIDIRC